MPARVVLDEHVAQVIDGTDEELILGPFSLPWPSLAAPEYMGDHRGRPQVENVHLTIYSPMSRRKNNQGHRMGRAGVIRRGHLGSIRSSPDWSSFSFHQMVAKSTQPAVLHLCCGGRKIEVTEGAGQKSSREATLVGILTDRSGFSFHQMVANSTKPAVPLV